MKAVIQRVEHASVEILNRERRSIGKGMLVLLGVGRQDGPEDINWLARKTASLRLFEDAEGRVNLTNVDADVLVVSQFTLLASTRKGSRPSFDPAAPPEMAASLYESFIEKLSELLGQPIVTGDFGAKMRVSLVNDGPFTLILDSKLRE